MILAYLLLTFLIVLLLLFWLCFKIDVYLSTHGKPTRLDVPRDCHSLIISGPHAPRHWNPNHLTPYQARSIPNRRHLRAFGIENAFTTSDEAYAREFVHTCRKMINLSAYDWHNLGYVCLKVVSAWKAELSTTRPSDKLVPLVQAVSLHAVLWAFFPSHQNRTSSGKILFDDLVTLAEEINTAWIASKKQKTLIDFGNNYKLQAALATVLPEENISDPRENPLTLILPGFETLWRIVLLAFLEIGYKTGHTHPEWRRAMVKFAQSPSSEHFVDRQSDTGASAKFLVNEALRVYPPTKRIYRAWQETPTAFVGGEHIELSADVDACHTDPEIWGVNASQFDPLRWANITEEQELAFLPFGCKPFECPAKPAFGPRMIGLLVGTMLSGFERERWELISSKDEKRVVFEDGGERLENSRDAYGGLALVNADFVPCSFLSAI